MGIGLLGAVGLGAVKLADNQKKAVQGHKNASALPRTMIMIKQLVSDPESCESNFKGKSTKTTLGELKNAKGEVQFKRGDILGNGELKITDIRMDSYSDLTNRARFAITFDKLKEGKTFGQVNRYTFVNVEASGGQITKCIEASEGGSEGLAKRFCKDIDPKQNDDCEDNLNNLIHNVKEFYCGKNHPFLKFDAGSGKCLPLDANKSCGSGFAQGYDNKGELICYNP